MTLERIKKDVERFRPKDGFNVVGLDSFEDEGEQLFLLDHFDDEKAANDFAAKYKNEHVDDLDGDKVYVIGANGEEG